MEVDTKKVPTSIFYVLYLKMVICMRLLHLAVILTNLPYNV